MSAKVILEALASLFGFVSKRCGLCDLPLDKSHGTICFRPADQPDIVEMKVCSECLDRLEAEQKQFREVVEEWKVDEDVL
jgi:hypothetical protein